MNLSYYPRPPQFQLEPIKNFKKKQIHNKREVRVKDPSKVNTRKLDTLNSSLMSYEQIDDITNVEDSKRPNTRNLTAYRKQNMRAEPESADVALYVPGKHFFKKFILVTLEIKFSINYSPFKLKIKINKT